MGILTVRLPDDVHTRWKAYCARLDLKPSTAVRQAIEQQVNANAEPTTVTSKPFSTNKKGGQQKVRVSLWITESEREAIRVRTALQGGSRAAWIVRLIRVALTGDPQLCDSEIDALKASTYELKKIGVNVNQISRRLNDMQAAQLKALELSELAAIRKAINAHTTQADRMIERSINRYPIR